MDKKILIGLILALLVLMYIICKRKKKVNVPVSNFGAMRQLSSTLEENEEPVPDSVLIFYAPWCGYCKKSMDDFNQASAKNSKIRLINSDQNTDLVKKYNVKGFPTIMKTNGQTYSGDRSVDSILEFAK
jgi:thiol-disulfide isomerase/thioredoxin